MSTQLTDTSTQENEAVGSQQRLLPFGRRGIATGLLLVPINVYLVLYMEIGLPAPMPGIGGPRLSSLSLFVNAIFFLLALVALDAVYARFRRASFFSREDLLIVYIMITASTAVITPSFLQVLVPMLTYPFRFATPENRWAETILPHLPGWATVRDPAAVAAFYQGHANLYTWSAVRPWVVPLMVWSAAALVIVWTMFCMAVLVRKQWIRSEKLGFPIVELAWHVTEPDRSLLKSRLMWIGFSISGFISLVNGLHILIPSLPYLNIRFFDVGQYLTDRPWSAAAPIWVCFFPFPIGLGFLLPTGLLGSYLFFFVVWKAVAVLGAVYGINDGGGAFPYLREQTIGGYFGVALFVLWMSRRHLKSALASALGRGDKTEAEHDSPMPSRWAALGLCAGLFLLGVFMHLLGLGTLVIIAVLGLHLLTVLAVTRIHAEFGAPHSGLYFNGPDAVLIQTFGSAAFARPELVGLGWLWWFSRSYVSLPMSHHLDGMKLADRSGTSQRSIAYAIAAGSVLGIAVGLWTYLHIAYSRGAAVGMSSSVMAYGREAFDARVGDWTTRASLPQTQSTHAMLWAIGITIFLYILKAQFVWWPIHPLGYPLAASTLSFWVVPFLIAWVAKNAVLRFGGLGAYRYALQFFLGLLIGDFIFGCMWPVFGYLTGAPHYNFFD